MRSGAIGLLDSPAMTQESHGENGPWRLLERSITSGRVHSAYLVTGGGTAPAEAALGFARALGAEVGVFTSRPAKVELARSLGATRVIDSRDRSELRKERGRYDLILSTVAAALDWARYVRALRPRGRLCFLGMPPTPATIPVHLLIEGQRGVEGSVVASPAGIRRMLSTAAERGVRPLIETAAMAEADAALARVREGKARLRMVLAR